MLRRLICLVLLLCCWSTAALAAPSRWDGLLAKYQKSKQVRQLIFVQQVGQSRAKVLLYSQDSKEKNGWRCLYTADAVLGENGLGKEQEGDLKTPLGIYGCVTAAGFAENPGTSLPYLHMDEHTFCSEEPRYYNRLQDDRLVPIPADVDYMNDGGLLSFTYSLQLDYNKSCEPGRGSYIFLHCLPEGMDSDSTSGCVALSTEDMKKILQLSEPGVLVCIFPAQD